MIFKP